MNVFADSYLNVCVGVKMLHVIRMARTKMKMNMKVELQRLQWSQAEIVLRSSTDIG